MTDVLPPQPDVSRGLFWVKGELSQCLDRVRAQMETYLEDGDDNTPLEQCVVDLHQVASIAEVIQCYSVHLLALEMQRTLQDLLHERVKNPEASFTALIAASLQLTNYIDLLAQGEADHPLVFGPSINELHIGRGEAILPRAGLFVRFLQAREFSAAPPDNPHRKPGMSKALARKHFSVFQKALAGVLRNHNREKSLQVLAKAAQQMASVSVDERLYLCWRSLVGAAQVLAVDPDQATPDVQKLLAKSGQMIKALAAQGEAAVANPAGHLGQYLLHLLALSDARSPELDELRQEFGLDGDGLSEAQLQILRRRLAKPNVESLQTVTREIRNSLSDIKDAIDLVIRAGGEAPRDHDGITADLNRLGGTLSVLGLDSLGQLAEQQAVTVDELAREGGDEERWMPVAEALLRIEQGLEAELLPRGGLAEDEATKSDLREGIGAVLRESLVNVARIKGEIDQYIARGQESSLQNAARLLSEIASGFDLLGRDIDVAPILRLRDFLQSEAVAAVRDSPRIADRFADVIASIEYYVEAVQEHQPHTGALLRDVERYYEQLEAEARLSDEPPAPESAEVVEAPPIDPEFRDIFIEEAREVLGELESLLPRWAHNPSDDELLGSVRRAFHTLKGSGRMVGAADIGEFGWAIEDLLNRCRDGAMPLTAEVTDVVGRAVELLPSIIQHFEDGEIASEAVAPLIDEAHGLIRSQQGDEVDAEVARIFVEDADENLAEIRAYLQDGGPVTVDEPLVRTLHTLRGSSGAAGVNEVHELAEVAESLLQRLRNAGQPCPHETLQQLHDRLQAQLAAVKAGEAPPAEEELQAELKAQGRALPAEEDAGGVDLELAAIFSEEAMSLLEGAESELQNWQAQPDSETAQQNLQRQFHTLKGSARTAGAMGIGSVGEALDALMKDVLAGRGPAANEPLFDRLTRTILATYDLLDVFREGRDADPQPALDVLNSAAEAPVEPAGDAAAESATAESAETETASAEAADIEAGDADADTAADARDDAQDDTKTATAAPEPAPQDASPEEAADDVWPPDPELLDLFLGEGQELLESIDQHFAAWEDNQSAAEPLRALQRDLHTFKGGARMAGLNGLGAVAHEMESTFAAIERGRLAGGPDVFGRLHHAIDGLFGLLDQTRGGQRPAGADTLLEDLRGGGDTAGETPLDLGDAAAVEDRFDTAGEPAPKAAPERPAAAELPPAMAAAESSDEDELLEIFLPEGAELMESFDSAVAELGTSPETAEPLAELLRVLHTLKGGARMAGLTALGDDAHDLESELEQLDPAASGADAELLARLQQASDRFHGHLDRARRTAPAEPEPESTATEWSDSLTWQAPQDERLAAIRRETARVSVEQLDSMLNEAGEISIYRSRLEQEVSTFANQLREMDQTIARVRDQLRMLESETDAQIQARTQGRYEEGERDERYREEFDPLEMDRYSRMQELTRALSESVTDLSSLHNTMSDVVSETDTLLLQQGRVNTSVQQGLMGTLMVPFARQVQRLQRVVRQTAGDNAKQARLELEGIEAEMDRNVLERMTPVLEHLMRNSVIHGIETPAERKRASKPEAGLISVKLWRDGSKLAIEIRDDGRGLNFERIRETAIKRGLINADAQLDEAELAQLIFQPGFSTAEQLTQDAGRGVGMDVVSAEVKQLGGTLDVDSKSGRGARFIIRLPLSLAIAQALLVQVADEVYATPLSSIEGIARVPMEDLERCLNDEETFEYGGQQYRVRHLAQLLGVHSHVDTEKKFAPVILVHTGEGMGLAERRVAIVVDQLLGSRELVTKTAGPQVSTVVGVTGATIQADGRVVLILDVVALVQDRLRRSLQLETGEPGAVEERRDERPLVMVIDDSITMRRVAERVLSRNGYRVATAKDGMDGIAQLQTEAPDAVLLDIEMPKVDGFEVANFIRNNKRLAHVPIVMITSRSGEKHRERATAIGVNRYLIKPYQEQELIDELRGVLTAPAAG